MNFTGKIPVYVYICSAAIEPSFFTASVFVEVPSPQYMSTVKLSLAREEDAVASLMEIFVPD